jgi:cell division protein FtsB
MTFKEFRNKPAVKFLSNIYVMIILGFLIWMFFFDENSFLNHRELNKEIDKLEKSTKYFEKEISQDQKVIKNLQNPDSLERFAREEYRMKKKDEDIYIIEFDTLKK